VRHLKKHRLGELVEILSGFAFDSEKFGDSGQMPIVRIRDVIRGHSSTFYSGEFDKKYVLRDGDMLIGMDGEFNLAKWQGGPAVLNQRVCRISASSGILDDGFLFRFLPSALKAIEDVTPFVTVKHLSVKTIRDIEIPLPPLAEQRRIAEVLDKAEALRAKRRAALAQLDSLTQSLFLDLFGDPATNSKGWPLVRLGDQTKKIGSGSTPTGGETAYRAEGISLIRSLNVRDGEFTFKDLAHIGDEQAAKLAGVIVEENDVLLNITGASVARVCRAPSSVIPARVNQHVCIIRPKPTLNAVFLEQFLLAEQTKRRLLKIGGAGATREAITKAQIEVFEAICPPIDLQREFARRVTAVEKLKTAQRAALAELDALFASLQHRAFRGELWKTSST
jgi:type I restriction enzyme S subunit